MKASEHGKVWRDAKDKIESVLPDVRRYRTTHNTLQSLVLVLAAVASAYEEAAEREEK